MEITNTRIYGLAESIFASGYPMRDSKPSEDEFTYETENIQRAIDAETIYSNNHFKRAVSLGRTKGGEGHDNYLNGIVVQFDLDIPIKVWTEAQRYHFLDFVSSMSTMHRLKAFELSYDTIDVSVDQRIIDILKEKQQTYSKYPTKENLLDLLMSAPVGMNLCARMTTNYRQLKTMHKQRKTHRLPHWQVFCEWCNELPLFLKLTGIGE